MRNNIGSKDSPYGTAPAPEPHAVDSGAMVRAALESRFEVAKTLSEADVHCHYLARCLPGVESPVSSDLVRVKVLSRSAANDRRQVELFKLEARAAASLSHEDILRSSEAEELGGVWFCVIEEKPGVETLQEHLKRRGWLDLDEALRIIQQVAVALEYAHNRGVLHLALDADNILLNSGGGAFLTGFGIGGTDDLAWAHQERSRRCSPRYISPEQVLGRGMDRRTDLYLLGIIIFEALTDRAPFEAEDPVSLRLMHMSKPPQPPHMFRPELSKALSDLVSNLLNKKQDQRPGTIGDLKTALEQCAVAGLVADEQADDGSELAISDPGPITVEQVLSDWEEEPQEDLITEGLVEESDVAGAEIVDTHSEEVREPVMAEPVFMPAESGATGSRRFVWLIALLILGVGLFWAIRAARFQDDRTPLVSSAAAETYSNEVPAASKTEEITRETERENPQDSQVSPSRMGSATSDSKDKLDVRADREVQKKGEDFHDRLPSPERAAVAPPSISTVDLASKEPASLPSELKGSGLGKTIYQEPPPAPGRSAQKEPPAPKVIRRSGDVLQNTAIIRPRPVFPEDAKKTKKRGPVTVEVTIDEEGSVIAARPVSGPRELHDSAVAAARRWKWLPTRHDRSRVKVVGTITLEFREK